MNLPKIDFFIIQVLFVSNDYNIQVNCVAQITLLRTDYSKDITVPITHENCNILIMYKFF